MNNMKRSLHAHKRADNFIADFLTSQVNVQKLLLCPYTFSDTCGSNVTLSRFNFMHVIMVIFLTGKDNRSTLYRQEQDLFKRYDTIFT